MIRQLQHIVTIDIEQDWRFAQIVWRAYEMKELLIPAPTSQTEPPRPPRQSRQPQVDDSIIRPASQEDELSSLPFAIPPRQQRTTPRETPAGLQRNAEIQQSAPTSGLDTLQVPDSGGHHSDGNQSATHRSPAPIRPSPSPLRIQDPARRIFSLSDSPFVLPLENLPNAFEPLGPDYFEPLSPPAPRPTPLPRNGAMQLELGPRHEPSSPRDVGWQDEEGTLVDLSVSGGGSRANRDETIRELRARLRRDLDRR